MAATFPTSGWPRFGDEMLSELRRNMRLECPDFVGGKFFEPFFFPQLSGEKVREFI